MKAHPFDVRFHVWAENWGHADEQMRAYVLRHDADANPALLIAGLIQARPVKTRYGGEGPGPGETGAWDRDEAPPLTGFIRPPAGLGPRLPGAGSRWEALDRQQKKEAFLSLVQANAATGCWDWQGSFEPGGYAVWLIEGKHHLARRLAWELWVGPIPPGVLLLQKNCVDRGCVNPAHRRLSTGTRVGQTGEAPVAPEADEEEEGRAMADPFPWVGGELVRPLQEVTEE